MNVGKIEIMANPNVNRSNLSIRIEQGAFLIIGILYSRCLSSSIDKCRLPLNLHPYLFLTGSYNLITFTDPG